MNGLPNSSLLPSHLLTDGRDLCYYSDSEIEVSQKRRRRSSSISSDRGRCQKSTKSKASTQSSLSSDTSSMVGGILSPSPPSTLSQLSLKESPSKCNRSNATTASVDQETSPKTCLTQARHAEDYSVDDLAAYLDEIVHLPKKMCWTAELMYA